MGVGFFGKDFSHTHPHERKVMLKNKKVFLCKKCRKVYKQLPVAAEKCECGSIAFEVKDSIKEK